jgi:hypothetical protein
MCSRSPIATARLSGCQKISRTDTRDVVSVVTALIVIAFDLIAQGITATSASRYVGVPWATWWKWLKLNHENASTQYDAAYTSHLEVMADRTLQIYEELKALRESKMAEFVERTRR